MAVLSDYQIQFAVRSTVARLGQSPPPKNAQIHQAIADRLGLTPGSQYAALWGYIRQGRQLAEAGAEVNRAPAGMPAPAPTVPDRGSGGATAEYVYRVVIDMFDPNTLTTNDWVVEVRSRTPLSAADAIDRAVGTVTSDPSRGGRYPDRIATDDRSAYSGRVITAGVAR